MLHDRGAILVQKLFAPLSQAFFARDTLRVARELLGQLVVRRIGRGDLVARIVETEAYHGDEPACHAHANFRLET